MLRKSLFILLTALCLHATAKADGPTGSTAVSTHINSADGLSYRLKVHLATDFACLRDVSVLDDPGMAERMMLNQAAEDSLRTEN